MIGATGLLDLEDLEDLRVFSRFGECPVYRRFFSRERSKYEVHIYAAKFRVRCLLNVGACTTVR